MKYNKIVMIYISLFLLFAIKSEAEMTANITVDLNKKKSGKVTNLFYGGFVEFLRDYINGPKGMYAQELRNRGFDLESCKENGISCHWNKYLSNENLKVNYLLKNGGYNENGEYSQIIEKIEGAGVVGVSQNIHINDDTEHLFYIYYRGDSSVGNVNILLLDTSSNQVLFLKTLPKPIPEWRKSEIIIPRIENIFKVKICIGIADSGKIEIDEVSLMPTNNKFGVRKEYYELYKKWKPGILRYPGGWFADSKESQWEYGIGDIDKRKSPNPSSYGFEQRLDFGTHEFIAFCNALNINPHITVNLVTATAKDAANWVEYCNGNTNTYYGNLRVKNGSFEPFKVHFWEVGNEQWTDPIWMTDRYLVYYDSMKTVDSSISVIIDGDLWQGKTYFDNVMNIVGSKCEVYGWHHMHIGVPKYPVSDSLSFLHMAGASTGIESAIIQYQNGLEILGLSGVTKQAVTEWTSSYGSDKDWLIDTNIRNSSLESGIWAASHFNCFLRHPESFLFSERTCGIGLLRRGENPNTGKKVIYGTPAYHVMKMMANHTGEESYEVIVDCEKYSATDTSGLIWVTDVPYIDASVTASFDSIYISIVNRSPVDTALITINIEKELKEAIKHQIFSEKISDANTESEPEKIVQTSEQIYIKNNKLNVLPHSFTIFAFRRNEEVIDTNRILKLEKIYPNPFKSEINLQFSEFVKTNFEIKIYNIIGQIIYKNKMNAEGSTFSFNPSDLSIGLYYILIESNGQLYKNIIVKY